MVWGFCVYFVYMIPLETDVLRKHRFQKLTPSIIIPYYRFSAPQLPGCPLKSRMFVNFNKHDINLCYSESYKTYMHSLVIASTAGLFIQDDQILTMSLI